ncbi:MAG: 3-oxoacyl-ACP reductase FabG [Candidatus Rokubacteria bacterium]|nr:3-oxoacyl-ACP reductase FabG [Candidatus Rokubacteria bacterium]
MTRLAGRVALVTGAGRGFGAAIATALAREGADVAVNYRVSAKQAGGVADTIRALGRRAVVLQADVARAEDVDRLVAGTLAELGRIDILVNNAGVMTPGPFLDVPLDRWTDMMSINVMGTMLCTRAVLPGMVERRRGRIINLSSQLARLGSIGRMGFAVYSATKGAVESFTKAIAREFGHHGVTVNAIAPGGIETDMSRNVMTPDYRARRIEELPVHRLGSLDDVGACVVFLASDEAGYLTGQVLHPSGGAVMP